MKKRPGILLAITILLSSASASATTSGYDSIIPELFIAVQGVPVFDLTQGNAVVDGNLSTTGGLTVTGVATFNGAVTFNSGATVVNGLIADTITTSGEMKVGEDGSACDGSTAGKIRYDYPSAFLQYCNGGYWVTLSSGVPSGTVCGMYTYGTGNGMGAGQVNCQGQNPINGCPGGYSQATSMWRDSTGGAFSTAYCVKN